MPSAGKDFEAKGEIDAALRESKRASEYDPTNRQLAARAAALDLRIREAIEASRPRPPIDEMRERARRMTPEPALNPASREPLDLQFAGSVRDLLKFIADSTGINITFTSDFRDPARYSVKLTGVTLEEALQQILSANALFYKVINDTHGAGDSRHRAEPGAIRRTGHSHVLPVTRRSDGARPAPQHDHARARRAPGTGLRAEQDAELGHHPGLGAAGRDRGAADSGQRSAEGRDSARRSDPRGQPDARQAVRPRPRGLQHHRHLLARGEADDLNGQRRFGDQRPTLQPELHLARDQRRRFLRHGADCNHQVPRDGFADEADGKAAAAGSGRAEDLAQPR